MFNFYRRSIPILLVFLAVGCNTSTNAPVATAQQPPTPGRTTMSSVTVRVIGPDGKLTDPTEVPIVAFSDAEWRKRLTPDQYRIARGKNTEQAFCGGLLNNKTSGMYVCVCCNLPLFDSHAKFDSKTGWPSFFQPAAKENIREEVDKSHGMTRTEILCRRCGAHLGHVFDDGPRPTGRRYCLNSESMRFVPADQLKTLAEPTSQCITPEQCRPGKANASRGGFCRRVFLVCRGRVPPTRWRFGGDQRLCRRNGRYRQLRSGFNRPDRPCRSSQNRLRSAKAFVRHLAKGTLRNSRSNDAQPPGQRRGHAISFGPFFMQTRSRRSLPRR